jgi:serine/threonine protein kinase
LHQLGYCHLDLKPGNILIDQSGMPKIIDFGLSRPPEGINRGGTRYYVSPQTLINRHYLDVEFVASFSDDVWSLATILSDFHLNPYNMTSYNPWLDFCHRTGWNLLKKEDVETNISLFYHDTTYLNVIMQKGLAYDREDRISMEGILEVLQEEKQRCDAALTTKKKKRYIFF